MIRSINYVRFLFPSRNWQCSWFWHFFFKQLLQMILAENDISQFRPDLVWKTQFVFMGVVTGNPFVSCPQLRAISASSTVYKVINQAMICTHKRNCTPARLFILLPTPKHSTIVEADLPGEDFRLLTHPACSIHTRM